MTRIGRICTDQFSFDLICIHRCHLLYPCSMAMEDRYNGFYGFVQIPLIRANPRHPFDPRSIPKQPHDTRDTNLSIHRVL